MNNYNKIRMGAEKGTDYKELLTVLDEVSYYSKTVGKALIPFLTDLSEGISKDNYGTEPDKTGRLKQLIASGTLFSDISANSDSLITILNKL